MKPSDSSESESLCGKHGVKRDTARIVKHGIEEKTLLTHHRDRDHIIALHCTIAADLDSREIT